MLNDLVFGSLLGIIIAAPFVASAKLAGAFLVQSALGVSGAAVVGGTAVILSQAGALTSELAQRPLVCFGFAFGVGFIAAFGLYLRTQNFGD